MRDDGPTTSAPKEMPRLLGTQLARARYLLDRVGISSPEIIRVEGERPRWEVVRQSPEAGTPLEPGQRVRLHVADESVIRDLPEIFQEDDVLEVDEEGQERSPDFLKRFLFVIQQALGSVEEEIVSMDGQFRPEHASRQLLPWLQELVPMDFPPDWSEERVREVLRRAPELLPHRGSARGLKEMIALYTGIEVEVHENAWPYKGLVVGALRLGEAVCVSTVPDEDDAFYVELPEDVSLSDAGLEQLLHVIDAEKPLHLRGCVVRSRSRRGQEEGQGVLRVGESRVAASRVGESRVGASQTSESK